MPLSVERMLRAYSNQTEEELWALSIDRFSLPEFQTEFGVTDPEDPMYDCWPVRPENVQFVERYLGRAVRWNFASEAYFLEANAA